MVPTLVLPIKEYLLSGMTAAAVTYLLVGPVRLLAVRLRAVAWPRGRDVHVTPTPRWGGLAMLGGVLAGIGVAYQLPALRLAFDNNALQIVGVMGAAGLLCVVGLLDDRYDLDALTKFAGQTTGAGLLLLFGIQWYSFWVPWGGDGGAGGTIISLGQQQGVLLTVLLTVALVNAMNFVDGLDGLAAGIGLIAASAVGLYTLGLVSRVGNDPAAYSPALVAAVLAGACLGFLPHNFNPARIFMGDSGSMLIGVLLAAATTMASGQTPLLDVDGGDVLALLSPLIVLAAVALVPMVDLLLAVVRRTRAGTSPFAADKMHLHHRLLAIGHSHRRAVLLIYLWAAVLAFGAVALALVDDPVFVLAGVCVGIMVAVLATAVPRMRALRPAAARPATAGELSAAGPGVLRGGAPARTVPAGGSAAAGPGSVVDPLVDPPVDPAPLRGAQRR